MANSIHMQSHFLVDIKSAIIRALRASFDDLSYPDDDIQGINISMDYPMEENSYPHLWVEFTLQTLQSAGIGHILWDKNQLKHEFMFTGKITLNIIALSSKSRDVYASQLIQMLAFRDLNPIAAQFDEYLKNDSNVFLTVNRDSLQLSGQMTTMGTPWNENIPSYSDSYSFDVVGQVESTFTSTPEVLKKIVVDATGVVGNDESVLTNHYELIENTVTPGAWV